MTKEDKNLLIKDLCSRLPYGVICFAPDYEYGDIGKLWCIEPFEDSDPSITIQYPKGNTVTNFCSEVKPYLRPLSSMTEEEKEEMALIRDRDFQSVRKWIHDESIKETGNICPVTFGETDYCNKNHLDYRGLIEKGLAIEALEGMYNNKK